VSNGKHERKVEAITEEIIEDDQDEFEEDIE
jgi:hypothetical protein